MPSRSARPKRVEGPAPSAPLPIPEDVSSLVQILRGQRVVLGPDLARLFGVPTKVLMQAVRRNRDRFPPDFAFLVEREELASLRSQIVTLKQGQHVKHLPFAFTEQGVAMLSSVLSSPAAIRINIAIMRAFVRLRETLSAHREFSAKLGELEARVAAHDEDIQTAFEALRRLMGDPEPPKPQIGFHVRERPARYANRKP